MYNGAKKKKPLHKPAEQHKEGALHFTSVWGRGTIRIIKGPKLTKALSKMSTSWQKKDQMSFPDKPFAPAGGKRASSCHNVLLRGNQPTGSFKSKSAHKYTFALILTSFSGALIDGSPHPHPLLRQSLTMPFKRTTFPNPLSLPFHFLLKKNEKTAEE